MEEVLQFGHLARHEAPVLADAVTAHRRVARLHPVAQKGERLLFGPARVVLALAHALGQSGTPVLAGVPFIHRGHYRVGLVDRDHRPFGEDVQIAIGDDGGDLDDAIVEGVQTGHFQIDPDEIVGAGRHAV